MRIFRHRNWQGVPVGWLAVPARGPSETGMFCSVPYRFYAPRGLLHVVLANHNGIQKDWQEK